MSVVLDTQPNGNYEPSESEIREYGIWLGMKLPEDNAFLWIARDGLKAPLPEHWRACKSEKGELYYFNFKTGQSIWDHPMDDHFKELFKQEKLNPTTQSVSHGAKASNIPHTAQKLGKKKAKTTESSAEPSEEKKAEGTVGKLHTLKTLKLRKEMPEDLKVFVDASGGSKADQSKKTKPIAPLSTAIDLPSTATSPSHSSNDGNGTTPNQRVPSAAAIGRTDAPDTLLGEKDVIAGGGIMGLKALSKLNSPSAKKVHPQADSSQRTEEEKIERKLKEELEAFQRERESQSEKNKEKLQAKFDSSLREFKESLEAEKKTQVALYQKKIDETLDAERKKCDDDIQQLVAGVRKELGEKKDAELRRLREEHDEILKREKEQMTAENKKQIDLISQTQRTSKAHLAGMNQFSDDSSDLAHIAETFIKEYENCCALSFSEVERIQNDFIRSQSVHFGDIKKQLESQIDECRKTICYDMHQEEWKHYHELECTRRNQLAEIEQVQRLHLSDLLNLRLDSVKEQSTIKSEICSNFQERQRNSERMQTIRHEQELEIDSLKAELKLKAEEELKIVMDDLIKEQRALMLKPSPAFYDSSACVGHEASRREQNSESPSPQRQSDSVGLRRAAINPPSLDDNLLQRAVTPDGQYSTAASNSAFDHQDIKTLITDALREVFAGSPFTLPSPAADKGSCGDSPAVTPRSKAAKAAKHTIPFMFPSSTHHQHALLESERRRVSEGRCFVESQRRYLEERRLQLKETRHQWKQKVLAAKQDGVRSSSQRGKMLNEVRVSLEEQGHALDHDEAVLRESEMWLLTKEQRLLQLERDLDEQEGRQAASGGDNSLINCSVDTTALITGFFKPESVPLNRHESNLTPVQRVRASRSPPTSFSPFQSTTPSPVVSRALDRIEKRLDEVTSMITMHRHTTSPTSSTSRRHHTRRHPSGEVAQGATRFFGSLQDANTERHTDPWPA